MVRELDASSGWTGPPFTCRQESDGAGHKASAHEARPAAVNPPGGTGPGGCEQSTPVRRWAARQTRRRPVGELVTLTAGE